MLQISFFFFCTFTEKVLTVLQKYFLHLYNKTFSVGHKDFISNNCKKTFMQSS